MKDENKPLEEKKNFLDVAKEYTKFFVGEEEVQYVTENDLQPYSRMGVMNIEVSSETSATTSESLHYYTKDSKNLLNILFESNDYSIITEADTSATTSSETSASTTSSDVSAVADPDGKQIGYAFMYGITVQNKKENDFLETMKNKANGLFGGALADLRNIKLNWKDGTSTAIGQLLDPDKWREAAGFIDIDINKVESNVVDAFKHDFPNNNIQGNNVKIWGKNALITELNRANKLTPEAKTKISNTDYSLVITTGNDDPNYPKYDKKSIAKTASKAFGTTQNIIDTNKVTEKDVIKIDDIQNKYKQKSAYEKSDDTKEKSNKTTTTSTSSSRSRPVSESIIMNEQDLEDAGNKEQQEKDTKRQEVEEFIGKELENQVKKELGDEQVEYGFKKVDDYIKTENFKDKLNDTKISNQLKKDAKNVLYLEITKEIKQKVDESVSKEQIRKMVNIIFEEMVNDLGITTEAEETKKEIQNAIQVLNPDENPERNEEIHDTLNKKVETAQKIEDVRKALMEKATKVLNNTVLNTINEKNLDIKDPKLDAISTYKILESGKTNESIQTSLFNILFEADDKKGNTTTNQEGSDASLITDEIIDLQGIFTERLLRIRPKQNTGFHTSAWGAISDINRVANYMETHNLSKDTISKLRSLKDKPYAAIVVAKRDSDYERKVNEGETEKKQGSIGNEYFTDESINGLFNYTFGKLNMVYPNGNKAIACDDAVELKAKSNELIAISLGYNKDSSKTEKPKLDIWVVAFEDPAKEPEKTPEPEPTPEPKPGDGGDTNININQTQNINVNIQNNTVINNITLIQIQGGGSRPQPIPVSVDIKILFFIILPDPTDPEPVPKQDEEPEKTDKNTKKFDWYIIPHKRFKDIKERPHQETHTDDGITVTQTSDEEYK